MRQERVIEYTVRVHPRRIGDLGAVRMSDSFLEPDPAKRMERYRKMCALIADDIRHSVEYVGSVELVAEQESVCGHCGSGWTEDDADYNGGCCDADQDAHESRLTAAATPTESED
jgi:hypothetical protein